MFDLLIKGGMVIDGSGNPGFYGAVATVKDRVRIIRGDVSSVTAERVIDASDHVVTPGFIDVHAHSALALLTDPRHLAKVHQGVTTELIGIDGLSYAPFRSQQDLRDFATLNAGLEGDPEAALSWSSVAEYLSLYDGRVSVNVAYIAGNSAIRIAAVGWEKRAASTSELGEMAALLRQSMEEGAVGVSTGLDYPPGSYADTEELVALCREAARLGGIYHTHVRYGLGDRYLDPFREAIEIGRRSGVPVHLTHLFRGVFMPGGLHPLLKLVEEAREDGLDVTFDCFPFSRATTRLLRVIPDWALDGGLQTLRSVLNSPDARRRLRSEVQPRGRGWEEMHLSHFRRPEYKALEGRTVADAAEFLGMEPVDAVCQILLDEDFRVSYVNEIVDLRTIPESYVHPLQMVGSDAVLLGDFPNPMAYGCYPVILADFVREERYLPLHDAIRRMTSHPAQRLGIADRGILRDGMKADIVVFDATNVRSRTTKREPKQLSSGVPYVVVNGRVVIDNGKHTGELPGRVLRHAA